MRISRAWAMPSPDTFSVKPIREFVLRYLTPESCDPFARNCELATDRNDLNPATKAQSHMEARDWLASLAAQERRYTSVLFDPPYSPRQISEAYQSIGRECGTADTQNSRLYSECRDHIAKLVPAGGHVLSFGWNSTGMGQPRGFEIVDILIVCHGGAHNDTICLAERRISEQMTLVA